MQDLINTMKLQAAEIEKAYNAVAYIFFNEENPSPAVCMKKEKLYFAHRDLKHAIGNLEAAQLAEAIHTPNLVK